jgi:hypothetical protein
MPHFGSLGTTVAFVRKASAGSVAEVIPRWASFGRAPMLPVDSFYLRLSIAIRIIAHLTGCAC